MSIVVDELLPSSYGRLLADDDRFEPRLKLSSDLERPVQTVVNHIKDEVIDPILFAGHGLTEFEFDGRISRFRELCLQLIKLISKKYSVQDLVKVDMAMFHEAVKMAKRTKWEQSRSAEAAILLIDNLKDYELNISMIMVNKKPLLAEAITKIDAPDFLKSLYGSYLAFLCMFLTMALPKYYNKRMKMEIVVNHANEFVRKLDSYTDTLDILTNSEEVEMMKRAEEWEKRHLQDTSG